MSEIPPDLIPLPEAARLLGISRQSMLRWIASGKVPGYRVGHRWRVSRSEVLSLCKPWTVKDANDKKIADAAGLPLNRRELNEKKRDIDEELRRAGIRK